MSDAEAITVTRHRCPHCRRSWANVTRANRHVADCYKDPARRGCMSCVHFIKDLFEYGRGREPDHYEPAACSVKEIELPGLSADLPRDCDQWGDRRILDERARAA